MPDHVHALLEGTSETADLRRMVKRFKQVSAHRFRQETGESLWASGYYEHVLRDEEATIDVILYILANPVRAGLAASISEYSFSGSDIVQISKVGACWAPN